MGRESIPKTFIHTLESHWNEVVHLSPIKPEDLKKALMDAGFEPGEMKFYQIDPELLTSENTTIFLNADNTPGAQTKAEDFVSFDPDTVALHTAITEITLEHYRESKQAGKKPLYFVGVPHILHKGSIDISKMRVIIV